MIVDIHTHAWPDDIAGKARENLESRYHIRLVGEPTVATLKRHMDMNGIDVSVVCGVATRPDQVPGINDWLFSIRDGRLRIFCSLHPRYDGWKEELKRIKARGDGVKLQPEFQEFDVDDEAALPMYREMARLGLPVLFHCGRELAEAASVRSSPRQIASVIRSCPELTVVAAHLGGFGMWQDVERYLVGKDIYLDTSFAFAYVPREQVLRIVKAHRPDRILFGSDFPLVDQGGDLAYLDGLDIADDLKERIRSKNAQRLLAG